MANLIGERAEKYLNIVKNNNINKVYCTFIENRIF